MAGARGGESGVLTCSALKRSYRDIIIGDRPDVTLVYLKGSHDLIRRRMAARHEHFMPVALLDSQFATLQEPTPDEHPIIVDVGGRPAEIAAEIVHQLEQRQGGGRRNDPNREELRHDINRPVTSDITVQKKRRYDRNSPLPYASPGCAGASASCSASAC